MNLQINKHDVNTLIHVANEPGSNAGDIARAMKRNVRAVYRTLPRLQQMGLLIRETEAQPTKRTLPEVSYTISQLGMDMVQVYNQCETHSSLPTSTSDTASA